MVSSESQAQVDRAKRQWKLPNLKLIGDPAVSLAKHLKSSGLLDVFISYPDPATDPWTANHPFMRSYTNGCAQPSTLFVSKTREVWFSHTTIPSVNNGGGAVDRPILSDVWAEVKRAKFGDSSLPRKVRQQGFLALLPWPARLFFVALALGAGLKLIRALAFLPRSTAPKCQRS